MLFVLTYAKLAQMNATNLTVNFANNAEKNAVNVEKAVSKWQHNFKCINLHKVYLFLGTKYGRHRMQIGRSRNMKKGVFKLILNH